MIRNLKFKSVLDLEDILRLIFFPTNSHEINLGEKLTPIIQTLKMYSKSIKEIGIDDKNYIYIKLDLDYENVSIKELKILNSIMVD